MELRQQRKKAAVILFLLFPLCLILLFHPSSACYADDLAYLKNLRNARLSAEGKDWDAAIGYYKLALAENSQGTDALKELALIYLDKKKDVQSACSLVEKLSSLLPDDPQVQSYSSFCKKVSDAENIQSAPSLGSVTIPFSARETVIFTSDINRLFQEKEYEKALQAADRALQADPDNTSLLILKTKILMAMQRIPDAKEVLKRIEALGIENIVFPLAVMNLAYIYIELDDPQQSLSFFKKSALKGADRVPIAALARFCEKHGEIKEAQELLDSVLRSCRMCADTLLTSAQFRAKAGDLEQAVRLLDYATLSDPSNYSVFFWLGHYHIQLKNSDKAIENYEKGLLLHEGDVNVYFNLGLAYTAKQNYSKASVNFEKAVELAPTLARAHLSLGNAYIGLKDWKKAESALKKSLELDPSLFNAYYSLSLVAQGKGDRQAEMSYLQKYNEMKSRSSKSQ